MGAMTTDPSPQVSAPPGAVPVPRVSCDGAGRRHAGSAPQDRAGGRTREARRWAARHPVLDRVHQVLVAVVGLAVVLLGLVLVPLPGPGWAVVFAGLTVLSTRFTRARRARIALQVRLARSARWFAARPAGHRALLAALSVLTAAAGTWACLAVLGLPAGLPQGWVSVLEAVPGW